MVYIIILFLFSGFLLIAISLSGAIQEKAQLKKISGEYQKKKPALKIFAPLTKISKVVVDRFGLEKDLRPKLDIAKIKMSIYEFFALKMALGVLLAVLTIGIFGKLDSLKIILALFLGYMLPGLWLNRKVARIKHEIARVLPETIDLLGLCIEAGLDFTMAIKWVIEKSRANPFLDVLAMVAEEIKWGKTRSDALRDMAKRLNISEVSSLVHTLVQADRLGTPVAEIFAILSEDTRQQRFRRGERFALKAPLKILIPLIFCILPVIGIIVGGPVMLQFVQGQLFKVGQ